MRAEGRTSLGVQSLNHRQLDGARSVHTKMEVNMGLLDDLLNKATGMAEGGDVHGAYDQVAGQVPQGTLADGLKQAFNSDQTPPFHQMLGGLFGQSSPDQKAGLLNRILGALGPG